MTFDGPFAQRLANEYAFVRQARFFTDRAPVRGWMYAPVAAPPVEQKRRKRGLGAAPGREDAGRRAAPPTARRLRRQEARRHCDYRESRLEPDCKWPALTLARLSRH